MNQLNQKNRMIEIYLLLLVDLFSVVGAYVLSVMLRFQNLSSLETGELHFVTAISCMLFCVIISLLVDWNRNFHTRDTWAEFTTVLKYNMILIVAVAFFLFLTKKAEFFSRLIFIYFFVFNLIITLILHLFVKKALLKYYQSEHNQIPILIITKSQYIDAVIQNMKNTLSTSYLLSGIAILDDANKLQDYQGIPVVANMHTLIDVAKQMPLDEVFIYLPDEDKSKIREIIQDFESMGIVCHYSIDIVELDTNVNMIEKFGNYTVVTYSVYFIDYKRRLIKRIMDIIGGTVGLLITGILFPFIAFFIKMDSKGPILFSQIRIGKNGRRFKIYKFRSMYINAEEKKHELQSKNQINGLMFKMDNDPRITRVGRFIRKTSIDELPQFYNILKGDMSMIGTRPPTEDEFEAYSPYYRRRLCMTPGLTGMWQVSGRSEISDFDEVVKYDLEYMEHWSLSLDIKILIQTIWVVITGRGSK